MTDNLTQCKHCGSALAYENIVEGKSYEVSCIGCGFMTNTLMLDGTEELKIYLETLPEIYSDLKFVDEDGLCWVPMQKETDKGVVTVVGMSKETWLWSFIPKVPLLETDPERNLYKAPDGSYAPFKYDFKNQEHFTKQQFLLALQCLGFFTEENLA